MAHCDPKCLWMDPEKWQAFGRSMGKLESIESDVCAVKKNVEALNHIRRRGAQWGATAGAVVGGIIAGIGHFFSTK